MKKSLLPQEETGSFISKGFPFLICLHNKIVVGIFDHLRLSVEIWNLYTLLRSIEDAKRSICPPHFLGLRKLSLFI